MAESGGRDIRASVIGDKSVHLLTIQAEPVHVR